MGATLSFPVVGEQKDDAWAVNWEVSLWRTPVKGWYQLIIQFPPLVFTNEELSEMRPNVVIEVLKECGL